MRRVIGSALNRVRTAVLAVGCVSIATTAAAAPEKSKVTIGFSSLAGAYAAFWAAKDRGYFKKEGLDVKLLYTRTTVGLQALTSGNIDMLGAGCAEFFEATRKGYENRVVANLLGTNIYVLAGRADIKDAKDFVGKAVAINRMGDTGYMSVRFALRQLGVDPNSVTYLQVGSTPERFSALSRGSVQGAVLAGALRPLIAKNKFNVVVDLQKMKYPSCLSGVGVRKDWVKTHPKTIEALLRAVVRGNAFISAGPEKEVKKIFAKYMKLKTTDKKLLLLWKFFGHSAHEHKPVITTAQASGVLSMLAEIDASWSKEKPARFLDQSFMKKLDESNYLESVYADVKKEAK